MPRARRILGWMMVGASLALGVFAVVCFIRQPWRFAAFTVLPVWVWGGCGVGLASVGGYFLRGWWSWWVCGMWVVAVWVTADETRPLLRRGKPVPEPGPAAVYQNQRVLRVVTLNCALLTSGNPAADLAAWQPDIVLLQEVHPHQARQLARAVHGGAGDSRSHMSNAILSRWKIERETNTRGLRDQQVTIRLPDGTALEVVNVHLTTAATDLRLWQRSTWRQHRSNRAARIQEMAAVRGRLERSTAFPDHPVLLGGDFNAPASDITHRLLRAQFVDAYAAAGVGWGDTFHRRFPILRIDMIYATRHFTPVRARTVVTRHSDHRMVVADFTAAASR